LCILCSSRIANSTISRPKEKLVAFISVTLLLGDFHIQPVDTFQSPTVFGLIASRFQIGLGVLLATSTANIVAVLRTLPAIVTSASDTGGCCSASPSRRLLTL
jgi:hypothetical protein